MGEMAVRRALIYLKCSECSFSNYVQSTFYDKNGNDAVCKYCFEYGIKKEAEE